MKRYSYTPVSTDHHAGNRAGDRGFTLVEMLVSVALVLLMMSLFATIFQIASGSVSKQRGISQNDQRARSVQTVIKGDLDKRTFRNVIPFHMGEDANVSPFRFGDRQGYFYLSINNPNNSLDDVLQYTINTDITIRNKDVSPIFGRSLQLHMPGFDETVANAHVIDLSVNPNQPEADDGNVIPNGTSQSPAAEVTLFVRNGKLYRRVLLLRNPLPLAGEDLEPQPTRPDDGDVNFLPENPLDPDEDAKTFAYQVSRPHGVDFASSTFWDDFDFSAFPSTFIPLTDGGTPVPSVAQFNGIAALNNEPSGSTFYSLGKPNYRFGFHVGTGQSREFTALPGAGTVEFLGRFLHEETSAANFRYPQGPATATASSTTALGASATGDPMNTTDVLLTLNADKTVSTFAGGPRRSEELLLANVHEFRVEIYDERMGQFTYPGHFQTLPGLDGILGNADDIAGDYHLARNLNSGYGPLRGTGTNRVFDTWFPYDPHTTPITIGSSALPPYRAMSYYPPGGTLGPTADLWEPTLPPLPPTLPTDPPNPPRYKNYYTEDANGNGRLDTGEDGLHGFPTNGRLDYDVVFPPTEDINGNGVLDSGEDGTYGFTAANGFNGPPYASGDSPVIDSHTGVSDSGYEYYFKCVQSGVSAMADNPGDAENTGGANNAPNWQTRPGALITENMVGLGSSTPAQWVAVPNLRPLRAVRITIRFLDESTQQMRQVTIDQSLVD